MPAAELNFNGIGGLHPCECGATFLFSFSYEDSDGNPVDLSNYVEIKMQIRKQVDGPLIAEFSTGNGRITVDSNENVTVSMSAEDTADLTPGIYVYDLKAENIDGFVERILEGEFKVKPEVTR